MKLNQLIGLGALLEKTYNNTILFYIDDKKI